MSLIGWCGHSRSRARRVLAAWLAALFVFAPLAAPGAALAHGVASTVTSAAADHGAFTPSPHAAAVARLHQSIILNELSRLAESKPGLSVGKPPLPGLASPRLDLVPDGGQVTWNGVTAGLPAHRVARTSHPPTGPPV